MRNIKKHEPSFWEEEEDKAKVELVKSLYREDIKYYLSHLVELKNDFKGISFDGTKNSIIQSIGWTGHYGTPNETYNSLYYSNQLNKAWFEYNMNDGKPVKLHIADKIVETTGKFNQTRSIGATSVADSIRLAFILRDKEALAFYATIPFEFVEREDQHHFIYEIPMALFQTLIKGIGNEHEAHGAYFEYRKQLDWNEFKQYVTRTNNFLSIDIWHSIIFPSLKIQGELLVLPELAIYHSILHNDQDAFEEAVYDALAKWKEYYTMRYVDSSAEEQDHSLIHTGYWAIPIIAACAFAYDRGMKLKNVSSDYLCDWMIEGRFEGFELLIKD
jgi:hypothetical protein